LLDAKIDPLDVKSLVKWDELLEWIEHEWLKLSIKSIKHWCKTEGLDWLIDIESAVDTEMDTLMTTNLAQQAKK